MSREQKNKEVDVTKDFDVNRDLRQLELKELEEMLYDGEKIKTELRTIDLTKCLIHILNYNKLSEELMINILQDIFKIIQAVAQVEMNAFTLRTHMKALVRGLEKNNTIDQNELIKIHDNEIVKEELQNMKDQYALLKKQQISGEKNGK